VVIVQTLEPVACLVTAYLQRETAKVETLDKVESRFESVQAGLEKLMVIP
jgi:hypothetical protein